MKPTLKPLFTWRSAILESDLTSTTKLVALALATYMSDRGTSAYPGATRLARDTSLHKSTVKERLAELERAGWLSCVERGGIAGDIRRANEYAAAVPDTPHRPVATDDRSPQTTRRRGRPVAVGVTTGRRGRPVPVAVGDPNSPLKLSIEEREGKPRAQPTRIPIPFDVTERMSSWANREHPGIDWARATEAFVDHYRAAPGDRGERVDWPATWRQWIRREANGAFR